MLHATVWHNPRSHASRRGLIILQHYDIDTQVIKYLEYPPSREALVHALAMLHMSAIDLMRTDAKQFSALGLDKNDPEERLIDAMIANPTLIDAPIVMIGNEAIVARPPEKIINMLGVESSAIHCV
jgi:arsenate reductase